MPTLFPDQERGAAWLRERPLALLADEFGVGKSATFLAALESGRPTLLVVPACLRHNWGAKEIPKWRPGEWEVHHVSSVGSFRWPRMREIVIASPEMLPATTGEIRRAEADVRDAAGCQEGVLDFAKRIDPAKALARLERVTKARGAADQLPPEGMILGIDEAHEFSNNKSIQTGRLRAIVKQTLKRGGRVHALTATPVLNDPSELWGLLTTMQLHKAAFGDWWGYLNAAGGFEGRFGMEWGDPRPEKIAAGLRGVMLRRMLDDVRSGVPALLRPIVHRVDIDEGALSLRGSDREELRRRGPDVWRHVEEPGASREDKVPFELIARVGAAISAAKVPAVLRIVEEYERAGEPLVVGGPFLAPIQAIGSRDGWATITGGESAEKRHAIVTAYARGELRGVAATIRAGGVGIDLIRGATVLVIDRDWVPSWTRQFLARVRRTGQTRPVQPIFVYADHPLETRKDETTERKLALMRCVDAAAERPVAA